MPQKVVLLADPGIDTSFAIALALHDPKLEVLGLLATAGNVSAEQATQNCLLLNDQLDPPRWPRIGAALPITYPADGTSVHGPDGLGGIRCPQVNLHSQISSDRLLIELVRQHPKEIALICLGPLSTLAIALERSSELASLLDRIIVVGGTWREHGNSGPVSEFHFWLDPEAARAVLKANVPITVVPLDVTRRFILAPTDLLTHPEPESQVCSFLRKIVAYGIRATANQYGIEGFHLKDVLGIAAIARPHAFAIKSVYADVEVHGDLTRGMLVVDGRPIPAGRANIDLAIDVDETVVREYFARTLGWK
ncbi:MAG: nucleoside hydrolase [Gemmataceae bacterium]|nr:nucleoside hydrolase [Gemmataceae bacterium]